MTIEITMTGRQDAVVAAAYLIGKVLDVVPCAAAEEAGPDGVRLTVIAAEPHAVQPKRPAG